MSSDHPKTELMFLQVNAINKALTQCHSVEAETLLGTFRALSGFSSLGQHELKGNYRTVNEGVVGAGGLGFVSVGRQAIQVKDLSGNEDNIR